MPQRAGEHSGAPCVAGLPEQVSKPGTLQTLDLTPNVPQRRGVPAAAAHMCPAAAVATHAGTLRTPPLGKRPGASFESTAASPDQVDAARRALVKGSGPSGTPGHTTDAAWGMPQGSLATAVHEVAELLHAVALQDRSVGEALFGELLECAPSSCSSCRRVAADLLAQVVDRRRTHADGARARRPGQAGKPPSTFAERPPLSTRPSRRSRTQRPRTDNTAECRRRAARNWRASTPRARC